MSAFTLRAGAKSRKPLAGVAEIDRRLVGEHPAIRHIKSQISRVARTDLAVMIRGESGTGKEIAARLIHALSPRASAPFEKINCAAIPSELLEEELFGYAKGAFTGAHASKPGRLALADKGTIFLDEIAELTPPLQAKLLQAVEDRCYVALGSTRTCTLNARVLASTNRDLRESMSQGLFRLDLYYRLTDIDIEMPPLRYRLSDIPLLVEHFMQAYARVYACAPHPLDPEQLAGLMRHNWPGNVRELKTLVKRYLVLGNREVFDEIGAPAAHPLRRATDNGQGVTPGCAILPLREGVARVVSAAETALIQRALEATHWNRRIAAGLLRVSYRNLMYKMKEYKLRPPEN